MADLGLYAVSRLVAALLGTTSALPGGTGIPQDSLVSPVRSGYEISMSDGTGQDLGLAISLAPLAVDLDLLPQHFINAVIAVEDRRFMEHPGLDPHGTLAALKDTMNGTPRGGSGLAQQMVKNTMVGSQVTYERKAIEAMLAVRAVEKLGHREVIRRYLQTAWFGRGRTGVMAAPRAWFGKEWSDVSLAESATLAAMLKGPSRYDPWRSPGRVKSRRDMVISTMLEQGWITQEEADEAIAEPVRAIEPAKDMSQDPWAAMAGRREIESLGITGRGSAQLTIDPQWQDIATRTLAEEIRALSGVKKPRKLSETDLAIVAALGETSPLPEKLRAHLPAGSQYSSFAITARTGKTWTVVGPDGREEAVRIEDPHPDWSPAVGDIVTGYLDGRETATEDPAAVVETLPGRPPRKPARLAQQDAGVRLEVRLATDIEGAIVAIDPRTGELIASVGGVDPNLTWYDRSEAIRPPGSSIKPFLYLAALDAGFGPQSPVNDILKSYRSGGQLWTPGNYDNRTLGVVPMHTALERSLNVATVWLAAKIGIDAMADTAEAAGVYPEGMVRVLPAALGASDATLADLTAGYASMINEGRPIQHHVISQLEGENAMKSRLPDYEPGEAIASEAALNDMAGMLRGVVTRGTARGALANSPVMLAGKTGTSQSHRDAWFLSMTPHIAIGVWMGRDDNHPLPGRTTGGGNAAPITARIMKEAFDAGLIDAEGWRDEDRSRDLPWPPDGHANLPRGENAPEDAPVAQSAPAKTQDALSAALQNAIGNGARSQAQATARAARAAPSAPAPRPSAPKPDYRDDLSDRNADLLLIIR